MPTVCGQPGCPVLVERGKCQAHRTLRPSATAQGYGSRWRKLSRIYLKRHPICAHAGCTRRSAHTHHLDGKGPLGPRGYEWDNLEALCASHHSQLTAREHPAGWNT